MDIASLIADFGFPTALLMIILWFSHAAGYFCGPLLKRGVDKHVELIDTLKIQTIKQTDLLEGLVKTADGHGEKLDEIHEAVKPGVVNP